MPDAPDDFEYSDVGEFTANLDSSELAARLYSPAIYARTGQILYMTDFSKGYSGLDPNTTGASQSINIVTTHAMYGGLGCKLISQSSDEGDCYLGITIPYVKARYYILDTGYFLAGAGGKVRIELYVYNGVNRYFVNLWHEFSPFKLETNDEDNNTIDITSLAETSVNFGSSNHLRIIIDTADQLYKKISLNSIDFAVSAMGIYTLASTTYPNLATYHSLAFDGVGTGYSYLQWLVISASDNL